jgi:CheY-like chemotaxis protein
MDPITAPRRPTALLLDDDGATSASYVRRLQHEGYQVTKTSDPVAALNLAERSAPAIIFVKMGLSGSGSTAFLQALRANDHTRHIPVALLTSYYNRSLERTGLTRIAI